MFKFDFFIKETGFARIHSDSLWLKADKFFFGKIIRADFIISTYRTDGIQHRSFPGVVLAHQNQGIFDIF